MAAITYYRGDSRPRTITVRDSETGLPIDITGATFLMTVDPTIDPLVITANLFQLTGTITNADRGQVEFAPTSTDTDQAPATYYYDIQMTDAEGYLSTIAVDEFIIIQDITK